MNMVAKIKMIFIALLVVGPLVMALDGCDGPGEEAPVTLAMLPFENLSSEQGLTYLGDGVAEELIRKLNGVERLRVVARTSSFKFEGTHLELSEIGRRLGVSFVLTGEVRTSTDHMRISARLIDVTDAGEVWAGSFEDEFAELFTIQDDIALAVVDALEIGLDSKGKSQIRKHYTNVLDAYYNYMLGRYQWFGGSVGSIMKSLEYYQAAVEADPEYALAYSVLAEAYATLGYWGVVLPEAAFESSRIAAERAVDLDDALSEAHTAYGWVTFIFEWDWPVAEREFTRAIELNPGDANALYRYSSYLLAMGRIDEAKTYGERAQALDPFNPIVAVGYGAVYLAEGDYRKAEEIFARAVDMDPELTLAYLYLVQAHLAMGEYELAMIYLSEGSSNTGGSEGLLAMLGYTFGKTNKRGQALDILEQFAVRSERVYVSSWNSALVHVGLGHEDETIEYLERAVKERYPLVCYLNAMPIWNDLRDNVRFKEILKTIGLE